MSTPPIAATPAARRAALLAPPVPQAVRPMRVLLVWTDITTADNELLHLGLVSLSGALKAAGHETALCYLTRLPSREEFAARLAREQPDVIGFSVYTNQWWYTQQLAAWARADSPAVLIAGGIHPTLAPEEVAATGLFHAVCLGEAEFALLEYLDAVAGGARGDDVANFWVQQPDGSYRQNAMRPRIEPLDRLPPPDLELFDVPRYLKTVGGELLWLVGRGCPYICDYCAVPTLNERYREVGRGGITRRFSAERSVAELEDAIARYPQITRFLLHDEILTLNTPWLREWTALYRARVGRPFGFQARIETMNDERLTLLREAGGDLIKIGLESGSESLRRTELNRRMSNAQLIDTFARARALGFHTLAYVMVGFPNETPARVEETLALLETLRPDDVMAFIFYPFPGTALYQRCKDAGFLTDEWAPDTWERSVLRLPTMTPAEIKDAFHRITRVGLRCNVERHPLGRWDLPARLGEARVARCGHPDGLRIDHFSATYEGGAFLYAPPPSRIEFDALPVDSDDLVLQLDLAVHPDQYDQPIAELHFRVELDDQPVLLRWLDPRERPTDRGVHPVEIPIPRIEGRATRRLTLITEARPAAGERAPIGGWGHAHLRPARTRVRNQSGRPAQLMGPEDGVRPVEEWGEQPLFSRAHQTALARAWADDAVPPGPRYVNVLPVASCNAACDFCPQFSDLMDEHSAAPGGFYERGARMDLDTYEALLGDLALLGGCDELLLIGGEPLLHRDIAAFVGRAKARLPGVQVALYTNGVLLERYAQPLIDAGLDVLSVSLNAADGETAQRVNRYHQPDGWARVAAGLAAFAQARGRRRRPRLRLSAVLTGPLADQAVPLYQYARQAGAEVLSFLRLWGFSAAGRSPFADLAMDAAQYRRFAADLHALRAVAAQDGLRLEYPGAGEGGRLDTADAYARHPCAIGMLSTTVLADGTVVPCCSSRLPLGSIRARPFRELWAAEAYRRFRARARRIDVEGPVPESWCHECQDLDLNRRAAQWLAAPAGREAPGFGLQASDGEGDAPGRGALHAPPAGRLQGAPTPGGSPSLPEARSLEPEARSPKPDTRYVAALTSDRAPAP